MSGFEFEHQAKRQKPQPQPRGRKILSTPPQREAYPAPPEPKTEKAKARVVQGIPLPERVFHEEVIAPLVTRGLDCIREQWVGEWCLNRFLQSDDSCLQGASFDSSSGFDSDRGQDGSPPVILSSTSENLFSSMGELRGVHVQNPSIEDAVLWFPTHDSGLGPAQDSGPGQRQRQRQRQLLEQKNQFTIPPLSTFLLGTIPNLTGTGIPGLGDQRFNLIVLDPPWPNRSVRRSGHYHTQSYMDMDALTETMKCILQSHLSFSLDRHSESSAGKKIAAIWVTNSYKARMAAYDAIHASGLVVAEEWAWVKTAVNGEAVLPVSGVWRKPYEVLVIGMPSVPASSPGSVPGPEVRRRVIAAVPDVHSRKPNLKELFEEVFFTSGSYTALEVFARNLTAGWCGCGDEVLRFNADEWWSTAD